MEPHDFLDDDLKNDAALFVLDALKVEDARSYRLHLAQCEACRREVDSLSRTARDLALLAPERTPPADLWQRVLQRIRKNDPRVQPDRPAEAAVSTQVWRAWESDTDGNTPDFTFLAAGAGRFEPTAVQGVEARKLFVDRENDRVTMLVRMQPGASYPRHVHADVEECFVLSGDLSVGTHRMHAGDYQRAESGSMHAVQSTENGCVLLLVSSLHDELV